MNNRLILCAIVRDESPYLLEWIAHHRVMGFDGFLIFDNCSSDGTTQLLEKISHFGWLRYLSWPSVEGVSPQLSAYERALEILSDDSGFVAFFDVDEFLIPYSNVGIKDYLERLPLSVGAVAVNQRVVGSNGHLLYKPEMVLSRFSVGSDVNYHENHFFKTISRIGSVSGVESSHAVTLALGQYIHFDGRAVFCTEHSGRSMYIDSSLFMLHHFIVKSSEEFIAKRARGGASAPTSASRISRYSDAFFRDREFSCNLRPLPEQANMLHEVKLMMRDITG